MKKHKKDNQQKNNRLTNEEAKQFDEMFKEFIKDEAKRIRET